MNPIKYIRGNEERANEIEQIFRNLGAKNAEIRNFKSENFIYYLQDDSIHVINDRDILSQYLLEFGEEIKLPEKGLPKTWEEWVKLNSTVKNEFYINTLSMVEVQNNSGDRSKYNYNNLSSKEDAEGLLALIKLKRLRDCYNDGWVPRWEDGNEPKFCIEFKENKIINSSCYNCNNFLAFRTKWLRDKFLNNFRDLIEKAKMWL